MISLQYVFLDDAILSYITSVVPQLYYTLKCFHQKKKNLKEDHGCNRNCYHTSKKSPNRSRKYRSDFRLMTFTRQIELIGGF